MADYARPDSLVTTEWVADNLKNPKFRLIEVDVDTAAYDTGHIPGAVGWNWKKDLETDLPRDIATKDQMGELLANAGAMPDTTVILYGDNNNWFAAYALWVLKYYGFDNAKLMNGGRKKWVDEGRELTTDKPSYNKTSVTLAGGNGRIRALRDEVLERLEKVRQGSDALVDVRSPKEFSGELLAPENLPQEGSQRGGHIPGAKSIPWATAVNEDGTFKSREELEQIYGGQGVTKDKDVIAYCRIGERSAHTWFVLTHLLGYEDVKNYDGSWTEWGSLIGVPIER